MRKRLQPTSGFTLVEMMVVVAILAIIAMMAAAAFQQLSRRAALQNATFDIQSSLSWARSRAMERGSDVWVIVYPEGRRTGPNGGRGAYFLYEDLTMRFARAGEATFGYDDFSVVDAYNSNINEGQLLETRFLEDYEGGAIRFGRVGTTLFQPPFTALTPEACSVCEGNGPRGAIVFTGDGTVRFYDGSGVLLTDADATLAIGNPDENRGFIFAIARATAFVAAQASY